MFIIIETPQLAFRVYMHSFYTANKERGHRSEVEGTSGQTVVTDATSGNPPPSACDTNPSSSPYVAEADEPVTIRKYDNPIYGTHSDKEKVVETDNSRQLSMPEAEHLFDNPIYATDREATENIYLVIIGTSANDGATGSQLLQTPYESMQEKRP